MKEWGDAGERIFEKMKLLVDRHFRDIAYDGIILEQDKGGFGKRSTKTYIAFSPQPDQVSHRQQRRVQRGERRHPLFPESRPVARRGFIRRRKGGAGQGSLAGGEATRPGAAAGNKPVPQVPANLA
jgi:hypothetical protein